MTSTALRGIDAWPEHAAAGRTEFLRSLWPAEARQLAAIRSETRRRLAPLPLCERAREDLVVAVNEAASNVIEHAYRPGTLNRTVEVNLWTEANSVNIEIIDHGKWRTPSLRAKRWRRGISLMQRLTETVMIRFDARGTRVLLRHPLPGQARQLPPSGQRPVSLEA